MDGGLDQVFFSLPERGQGAEGSQPWPASLCAGNALPAPPPRPPARAPPPLVPDFRHRGGGLGREEQRGNA